MATAAAGKRLFALSIWQWGLIENLVDGLQYVEVGSHDNAKPLLAVADACAAAERG